MSDQGVVTSPAAADRRQASSALEAHVATFPVHLTVEQLGQLLGVATKTAYEYLQAGDVPAYRIGKRWIILRDEVRDFLVEMRTAPHS